MAISQFSADLVIARFDDTLPTSLGSYELQEKTELQSVRMRVFSFGTKTGLEKFTLRFTDDINQTTDLATSSQFRLDSIENIGEYWFGWITFSFPTAILPPNSAVYGWVDAADYTLANDNFFAGVLDYPVPVYDNGSGEYLGHPVELQFFGEQ